MGNEHFSEEEFNGFGPGSGPGFGGFGHGPRGMGGFGRGNGGRGERLERGHLTPVILSIIKERPRHGYDIIKEMEKKSHGFYTPSAGSVYPILQSLEDQGFILGSQETGKKIYTITSEGEKELKSNEGKFKHLRTHMHERFGGMERYKGLMMEMGQTTHFVFSKLREKGIDNPETIKKLRLALTNFRNEAEEILLSQEDSTEKE